MAGLLIDHNCEGQVEAIRRILENAEWLPYWQALSCPFFDLERVGLDDNSSDREIWRTCQKERLMLVTSNRNQDDEDSLEAVIKSEGTPSSMPVFTFADADHVLASRDYAERVALRLMEFLLDIDNLRGVGRIYLP